MKFEYDWLAGWLAIVSWLTHWIDRYWTSQLSDKWLIQSKTRLDGLYKRERNSLMASEGLWNWAAILTERARNQMQALLPVLMTFVKWSSVAWVVVVGRLFNYFTFLFPLSSCLAFYHPHSPTHSFRFESSSFTFNVHSPSTDKYGIIGARECSNKACLLIDRKMKERWKDWGPFDY